MKLLGFNRLGSILVLCYVWITSILGADNCFFTKFYHQVLFGYNDLQLHTETAKSCGYQCLKENSFKCLSYEYNTDNKVCALSQTNKKSHMESFGRHPILDYYELRCETPVNFESFTLKEIFSIINPVAWYGYGISSSDNTGNIILFSKTNRDIRIFNPTSGIVESQQVVEIDIIAMATTGKDQHVAITANWKELHLFDRDFKTVRAYRCETSLAIHDVIYLSEHRFIMLEKTRIPPYNVTVTTITIANQSFISENVIRLTTGDDYPLHVVVTKTRDEVLLVGGQVLYVVSLEENKHKRHDLSWHVRRNIRSMYLCQKGQALLGDSAGHIYQLSDLDSYIRVTLLDNLRTRFPVVSMTMRHGKFYVTTDQFKIHIYQ